MNRVAVPVNEPLLDGNERRYLAECVESGWISSEGGFVTRFEEGLAAACGRRHGIAVCNGSAALDLAVAALGLGRGDEVIMPAFTIISCAAAVVRARAVPVLVDADPLTWNMDVSQVASRITARTRAILVVHVYGLPVDMGPVLALAAKHGLAVIEDAAEAQGQTYRGVPCGGFGDASTFSFYSNKHVTTGEGGMVLANDDRIAERCRSLRNLCFQSSRRFQHEELGWNFRMSNLQAALGVAQLERLGESVRRKRAMGARYTQRLRALGAIQLPLTRTEYAENVYWAYGVVLNDDVPIDAERAMKGLAERGVGSRPFFWPMHEQPVFRRMGLFRDDVHPVSERLARRGFYLPSGVAITGEQIDAAATALEEVVHGA
jgi:perosamine synthetase